MYVPEIFSQGVDQVILPQLQALLSRRGYLCIAWMYERERVTGLKERARESGFII
jgi:hypothetical protein